MKLKIQKNEKLNTMAGLTTVQPWAMTLSKELWRSLDVLACLDIRTTWYWTSPAIVLSGSDRNIFRTMIFLRRKLEVFVNCQNGILFPKLFWPSVRKKCSIDREKVLQIYTLMFCMFPCQEKLGGLTKIQNLTAICCMVKLIPWNLVNLSHL